MQISAKTQFLEKWVNDPVAVRNELANYKERGAVVYEKVMQIPVSQRIPALVETKEGRTGVLVALVASLKSAFDNLNLDKKLNEEQVVDLADKIIDQSFEDNLSIQDVLLFLEQFLTGQTGKLFNRLDMPTFFEKFEMYRQKRHEEILRIREEQHANYKALGKNDYRNTSKNIDRDIDPNTMQDLMKTMYDDRTASSD